MLRVSMYQISMAVVDPDAVGLEADSFERHLPAFLRDSVPIAELGGLEASSEGAPTRCPLSLLAMLLLQFRYGLSERELQRRCQRDLGFRYALGLEGCARPPSARTLRRFRERLIAAQGEDYVLRLSLRVASAEGLLGDTALQAIDSTNTDCRGAVIDTFNLVAAGIRQVLRAVARSVGVRAAELAKEWALERYMARSVKGAAAIDWSDEKQRNALLTQEIRDADQLVEKVRELHQRVGLPEDIQGAVDLLVQVAQQDVQRLDDGTYRIAKGTVPGRIISMSDPEARHGRKSASKVIHGFKTHVTGTIDSQFVTGIAITDAATHDGQPTPVLIAQTATNGVKPTEIVGDNAYGAGANIRASNEVGVQMRTKPSRPAPRGAISKREFDIDIEQMVITCPADKTATEYTWVGAKEEAGPVPQFRFASEDCQACDLRSTCSGATAKGGRRVIRLSPYEREHQQNRAFAESPQGQHVLRARSSIERLISHLVRMGMRHARFFTMKRVQLQAFLVAASYNLQRIFTIRASGATDP